MVLNSRGGLEEWEWAVWRNGTAIKSKIQYIVAKLLYLCLHNDNQLLYQL